jgi:ubiquinone/menaquinone biosynthesis C-methylase UbiE
MKWLRRASREPLVVSMAGVKLGERALILGTADPVLVAGVGTRSGLTGRTCVVGESDAAVRSAVSKAEADGALVEGFAGPWSALPFDEASFDVVLLRDILPSLPPDGRAGVLAEVMRVLRPGGRVVVIDNASSGLLGGWLGSETGRRFYAEEGGAARALENQGFKAVRPLAERESMVFTEGARAAISRT